VSVSKEIDISAPPDQVYAYLSDFTRHSEWTTPGHGVHITPDADAPAAVGSTYTSEAHQFGAQRDKVRVTELDPGRRIVYEATMKNGSSFRHMFDLSPNGAGTHLTKRFEGVKLGLMDKLTYPLASRMIAPGLLKGDLERIKSHCEAPVQAQ
jgi:uncharacterized protein YndB with AHSA1/START domain